MYEKICSRCSGWFEAKTSWGSICPECKRKYNESVRYQVKPFEVVSCPVDETGVPEFPTHARFSRVEIMETIKLKYFPTGMILRKKDKYFKVVGMHLVAVRE